MYIPKSRLDAIRIALAEATHITHQSVDYSVVAVHGDEIYAVSEDPCVEGEGDHTVLTVYGLISDRDLKISKVTTLFTNVDHDAKKD